MNTFFLHCKVYGNMSAGLPVPNPTWCRNSSCDEERGPVLGALGWYNDWWLSKIPSVTSWLCDCDHIWIGVAFHQEALWVSVCDEEKAGVTHVPSCERPTWHCIYCIYCIRIDCVLSSLLWKYVDLILFRFLFPHYSCYQSWGFYLHKMCANLFNYCILHLPCIFWIILLTKCECQHQLDTFGT